MQKFRARVGSVPKPPASGGWGLRPQTPKTAPHCEFLATRLRMWMFGFRYHSNRNRGKCHAYDDGWIWNHRQHNTTFGLLCCHRIGSPGETLSRNSWNENKICKQTKQVFSLFATQYWSRCLVEVVLLSCYPIDHFKGWGCGGTPLKPNIWTTPLKILTRDHR